jgi:tape measure domain-containing protein
MNLGELIVELCADTAQLEKSLEQAKKKAYEAASSIEKTFEKINLEINVDDDSLTDLNKHLNLKVQHLKEVNKYFNNNPIVVNVDDDSLTDLNKHLNLKVQHLKEVNKYFNNNPIVVNTDVTKLDELEERLGKLSNKTITITVESELSKQLEKSLTDAVQSAVRDAVSESSVASSQQQAQKDSASSSKAQRVDVVASPMRSIIDGAFENVGKRLTKGINSSIEDTIGVSMDDMTRMSGNMLLRYFGVGKKAQSDPKNEQKRIEAIFKDGMDAFIRTHDSRVEKGTRGRRATRSAANDDIGVDFESASRIASSSALRYFGVGKKAQSDPKNEQARVKAIIEDAIKEYSGSSIKQSNSGVISSTFSEINKAFSDSINVTIESVAQNAKLATIRQARQSAKAVTQNSAPGVQNAISGFFDAAESSDKGAVNKYIGEGIASQSKKAVESIFNRLLPNASPVIKDFLKTGVSAKPVEPIAKSSSDILKEAASDLKNAAKALSDAAVSVKSTEPTAKTSKPFVAKTISDPWQDAAPLPKQLPPKANKSPLPPPQQKRELEPIPVNIPEQIKPLFKTIQSEIHKNIDISEGYKNATKSENNLTPLPSIPSSKNTKKYTQVSLDSIEQSLIAINKYFSDEYKRIQAKVKYAISDAGTKEDISAARSEVSNFVSRSKEAISTIDRYVKTGQDAGFSKDINSELSRIHSSGKSSISRNTSTAEKSLGKLNLADKKLFDQQLKGYVAQAESLGIEVDAGLKKGIQHAAGGVSDAARAMLDDLIKAVKAKMEIQSPSKVMIALGLMIASGLAIGIKKGVIDVSGASDLLTDVVGNGLKNIKSIPSEGIESYDQAIKNAVSSNSETTKKVFDNAKKASKATIPGMILGTAMMGVADTNLVPKSIRTPLRHLGAFYQGTTQVHKLNPQLAREAEIATIFNMMQSAEKGDGYFPDGGVVGMVKHKTLPTLAHTLGGFNYTQTKDGGLQINDVYDWHQDTDTDKNTPFKLPKNLGSKIYKFLESKKWLRGLLGIEENLFGNTKAFTKYNKKTGRELFSFLNTQSGNDFQLGHSVHSELIGGNPYIQTHRLDRKGLDDLTDLAANPYIASKGNFGQFLNHPKIQEYVLGNGQESQQPTGNNNLLGNLFNNAKSAFSKGGGLKEVGINLISSFGQGFLSANGGVLGIVIGFAKGVLGAVKKVFGIASPSKVMESIGLNFGEGFENGAVAALVLANKRIAELMLKTVNESATATESEKARVEHFANTVESQNQRIAKGFREGKYNDLNASKAMEILASSTTVSKVMARITGASMAEIPGILQQARRDVKSSPVTENVVPQPVSTIITPRSFAPNPNARLVLPNSTTVNPNARLILPNSTTANPDARLILPSRPSTAARATITQQEVNTQALINKNKDLLVNLNALLNRSMTASLTGFATVLDDLMNAPRSSVVRSLTRQVGARLPVVLPPTVSTSLVPEPFKSTTIKPSLPTGLGFFPIPASPAKPPAVTPSPFAPTSPPPPPIPPAPPSLSSPPPPPADGFLPIRVRTPQNATNQYLQLGKDLVTNLFTAVGDSIRQSTLSGYASLGQVMRNAVNAALFSLADTLKQPLYKGLLSQAQSALPWFMKFIPKTMQLIPMLKPLMPIIGGLTLGLGNSIVKNLLNNDVLKPGGFLTKLLSSVTRINLTSLSGGKAHGILGAISKIMNPVPNLVGTAGIGGPLSLAMGLFGPLMNTFSGILGLDPSTRSNPKNQAPTVERVLQEQTLANRKKAGLSNAKGGQASRELIENLGNTAVDSVLENLNIPMIPTSVIQGMTGRSINKQSGKIADVISSIGVQRSKTEKALERAMKSGTISPERLDALTKAALRRRGVDTTTREAMSREELEKARQDIIGKPLAISENERNLMFAMGDIERSRFKLGVPRAQRRLDYLTAKVLKERGVTFSDYTSMKQSGKLEETRRDLAANPNTTGVVGRLTQAYATNDQEALKGLLMQGLKKAGMSSEQLQNIDPKLLNTATAGLMATLTGLQAKFKEKGFDMGKALTQGFKDSVRNLANAKDDLEYNAKKAIGQANFGDAVGLIFRRMTRGTIATQDQFKEMYNQMGTGVKKALFSSSKEADAMFPNMLQFMGSLATTLAPVTSLFASLSPLFLPLAPIIGGIGAAVSMVMPHISKMLDGIQRVEVLQRRFTFLGGSKAGGEAEFKYAKDVAAKMNVPSEVAANSYSQLAIAARGSKMEGQGVKDLFEGITASLSALGISGQDASLVFMAYTQILAKGKLSMEELRQQLGEKFPPAMGVFAKSMGVSVPEMNALVASGSILSQDILPNVAKVLNQDYGASAANQAGGLVVALNKLGNVGFEITTIFTDKLGSTLGWFVGTFADGLALFSNTLGALIPLGQAFAIGFAATIAIGLTTIMTKVKPLVVLFGSLQNLLMATFTAVATNMMPMIIGVTADVADNWLGAEKDLITNMMDGVTNAVVATFSTVDSVMRSMSGGNFSFSSMFGGLVQGAEQAGNIIDWLKGVFSGFFKIIPPGFVELLAMVFMFEQGTGLMVMALAPAFKGFIGAVTGMFGGAAKAFVGVMTSMKIATELMMTSMSSAMAASEARIKIFSATMGFLRTALTHVAVAFGILMFSKGDFSNPMGDSLSKTTKELNNGLTEIRANVQKTADSFDKATNSVTKLGGTLADTLPSKGIQLDIRSFWGGGDFKWDDAIKERNKRDSASGSLMDAVGVGALGAAGAGAAFASGISVLSSILNSAVSTAATIAANKALIAGPVAPVSIFGRLAMAVTPLITAIMSPLGLIVVSIGGFIAAIVLATKALDLFAPKLTGKQKQLIADNKLEGYFDLGENARLTNAQQQILKYFEDQKKNIQNLKEFGASQGFTGKPGDFMADIKPLTSEQQNTFNNTPAISKLNQEIKDNNKRRLAAIADKKNSGASPQEIKDLQNSPGFKELENKSKQMRNVVALAAASFQIENTPENQRIDKELDGKIKKKQAEIDERRAAVSASRNLMAASSTDAFALSMGDGSDAGTIKLEDELKVLEAQKKNQQKLIKASVQRAFNFQEIKDVDKQLINATKKGVELSKALPSDKVRKEQGEVKQLIQQLYKRRQELVDSFGSPLPILENQLKKLEKYKEQLTLGEVEGIQGALITPAVQETQRQIEELKKQIAGVKPFDVKPVEEMLYTQATNAVKDANIKFERASSANRSKSNLSQSKVYSSAGTSQQIAPELANIQLAGLNDSRTLLEEKLKTNQIALDKIAQVIAVGGTNLAEAQSEYDKLTEDIMKDRESLTQNALETAKARRDMKQALIDQTKQVAEYYRTSVREAQSASIEFEKARITLEGSKIQNRLRQALIGAGNNIYTQFVEGIINIISKSTEIEKRELDFRKQQIDYRNNLDAIKLRAAELQQSLPGKIIPFDDEKVKRFNNQLEIVNIRVNSTNSQTQKVAKNIGTDAVNATNSLNNSFVSVGKTIDNIGEKIDSLSIKLQSTPRLFTGNSSVGSLDWFEPALGSPQSRPRLVVPTLPPVPFSPTPSTPPTTQSSIKLPSRINSVEVASLPGFPIQIAQFQKLSTDPKRNFKGTGSFTSPSGKTPFATPMVTPNPTSKPKPNPTSKPKPNPTSKPKPNPTSKPKPKPLVKPKPKPLVKTKSPALSSRLMEMVKKFENFSSKAYSDYNQYSIGYGTVAKSKSERISRTEATKRLNQELLDAQNQVKRLVKVPLNVNQLDALTSLTFNVGQGALKRSALLAKLNTGDYVAAANEFAKLNKADRVSKNVADALTARRLKEKALFNTAPPDGSPIYRNENKKPVVVKPVVVEFVNPNAKLESKKLDNAVINRKALEPDKLQEIISNAAELYGQTENVKNVANDLNYLAQANTEKLQQQLDLYRLIQQTTENIYQALSGIADLELDSTKTIEEGLSPYMSPMKRMELEAADYERSLQKKREGYEKSIRDAGDALKNQNPVIKRLIDVELVKKFPDDAKIRNDVSKLMSKTAQVNALQFIANTKALIRLNANIPAMIAAFKDKREGDEVIRVFGLDVQDARSSLDIEQKKIEQLKVLQTLDPLNPEFNKIADNENAIALKNNEIQYKEKQTAIADLLRTKQIDELRMQKRLEIAEQEYLLTEKTIKLKTSLDKINENTSFQNKLLERAQYLQDSIKGVSDSRSSLLKSYGLDFSAEKLDKQSAISSQGMEFDKASIQLEDFIEKNKLATEANRLTNEQINELRENLRLTNEYKLDAIKLQFSELASVIKNTTSGFRNGFKEFLLSTKSFGESLTDLFNSITKNLIDSLADIASKRMTDSLFGWVAGLFGGKGAGLASGGSFVGDVLPNTSFNMAFAGGMVGELPTFANGGIVGALNKERSLTGRVPHVIIASEGERVLNHKETAIWNKLQGGVAGFANGGVVGTGGNGTIASRMGNTTTINVPVSVAVGSDSEVDTRRLSQAVQAMVSDGIRREMRVGGSINRGNPYGR